MVNHVVVGSMALNEIRDILLSPRPFSVKTRFGTSHTKPTRLSLQSQLIVNWCFDTFCQNIACWSLHMACPYLLFRRTWWTDAIFFLQVHFRGYPATVLTPCEGEDSVKWSFINSLKEVRYNFLLILYLFYLSRTLISLNIVSFSWYWFNIGVPPLLCLSVQSLFVGKLEII